MNTKKLEDAVRSRFNGATIFVDPAELSPPTPDCTGEGIRSTLLTDADLELLAERIASSNLWLDQVGSSLPCPDCRVPCTEHSVSINGVHIGTLWEHSTGRHGKKCISNQNDRLSLPLQATDVRKLVEWLRKKS